MDEKLEALLLLNSVDSLDARVWRRIREANLSLAQVMAQDERMKEIGLTENAAQKIRERLHAGWAEREFEACAKLGVRLVTCEDEAYPAELNDLADAPILLYVRGELPGKRAWGAAIGVVGTRRATSYGRRVAQSIGAQCATRGLVHVSGGASGIDGCSHIGCLQSGGVSVAVFGTGVDVAFPASHKLLFEDICQKGALVSEYPLGTKGEHWRFPRRNRLVAALSSRLIVAEAPEKSGAMITARLALELGREVWAVPGRIDEEVAGGANRLIYDGAHPFIDMDIFFGATFGQQSLFSGDKTAQNESVALSDLSEEERLVYEEIRLKGERTVDNIAVDVKMSAAGILKVVALLSAKGKIYSSGPGRYSAKV